MGGGRWGPTSIFIQGAHNSLAMALEDCTGFHSCQARTDLSYSWHRFTETIQLKIGKKRAGNFYQTVQCQFGFSHVFLVSAWVSFHPQQHSGRWISYSKLSVVVNDCANVFMMPLWWTCAPSTMYSRQCSLWDRLPVHHGPDQDKVVTEVLLNGQKLTEAARCKGKNDVNLTQDM